MLRDCANRIFKGHIEETVFHKKHKYKVISPDIQVVFFKLLVFFYSSHQNTNDQAHFGYPGNSGIYFEIWGMF